ncbi:DUF4265 domain-containing protein [Ramlibacter sp. WS9]|uniref:DUF4265 domain-containing protein n=1 Tax=Ramlibacter sp. WS9 TaxID=1882741 RepID=UPI0013052F29|nr:DUF4265 domain-containing protein [Ramlibacter sp. WS9]
METTNLTFALAVDDGWPPVAAEGLPCRPVADGFEVLVPPLFVKGLAVGDVIRVKSEVNGQVTEWETLRASANSTVWLMVQGVDLRQELDELRALGCNTSSFPGGQVHSIDVPSSLAIEELESRLDGKYSEEQVALAYPVWRRED